MRHKASAVHSSGHWVSECNADWCTSQGAPQQDPLQMRQLQCEQRCATKAGLTNCLSMVSIQDGISE